LYSGKPANVEFNLPAAVNISSTTNASPIVVTTAAAHKCLPGDYLAIVGAQDPNANGRFRAGSTTSTTVALLTRDGFNTTGTLVGGAQGTLKQAGYGTQVQIAADGDRPLAPLWNVPDCANLDRVAWLEYVTQYALTIQEGGFLTRLGRARRRPRVIIATDSNHTIDTTQGDCFELNFTPASTRTITLRTSTFPTPEANELIEIVSGSGIFAGTMFSIQREDATVICTFRSVATVGALIAAQFEFNAGVWRLGLNSGRTWDAGAGANIVGVVPGAGA
jgi:hypothetical protein